MKYLSFLLFLLFFTIKINAEEVIDNSRLFKIYLNNVNLTYGDGEEPPIPDPVIIPDADGDGIRDEEDPDHPSNDEDNYASWRVFLNTFCGQNFSNDQDMYSSIEGSSIYCKNFAKMPTEELQSNILGSWDLEGDNRFNSISGLSQVTNFKSLSLSTNTSQNHIMSQPINLSNLSGKTFETLNFHYISSSNLSGVGITEYLTLYGSYIQNISSSMIAGCCTQLRWSRVDNYTINSTGKLNGIYIMHGSELGNLTINGNKQVAYFELEKAWDNGNISLKPSTLNNTNAFSGLLVDRIIVVGNTEIPMDLSGLSTSLNRSRVEELFVRSKDFDFGSLSNVNSIGRLYVYSTKIDFRDLQYISVIEEGTVDTYSDSDWNIIPEGQEETFIKNINIIAKAPMSSNFCQGLQNGSIHLSFKYSNKNLNIPISEMCE